MIVIDTLAYHKHQFSSVDRTLELYFAGCHHNCPDCQNKELQVQSIETCRWLTPIGVCAELFDYVGIAKQVHILGGEPLEQPVNAINELTFLLKELGFKNIILFTGSIIPKEFITKSNKVFEHVDYVKTGPYDKTKPNIEKIPDTETGIILASTNQKIYKVT